MDFEHRKYQNDGDFAALCQLVAAGRAAGIPTHYPHSGDLGWWYFYAFTEDDPRQTTYLWDDPHDVARLLGWALIDSQWGTLDVFSQPELWDSTLHIQMQVWAENQAMDLARLGGKSKIRSMWVSEQDAWLRRTLESRGFQCAKQGMVCLEISLEATLPELLLPEGFQVRPVADSCWEETRARAQYAAFENEMPFEKYLERYRRFRRSPVYTPELDLMIVSPEDQAAAFCICWPDSVNRVGLFEPVGVHPDFQRKGLGRAIMLAGLHRLQTYGMTTAIVSTGSQNDPAIKLYESVGFKLKETLLTYEKEVETFISS